MVLEKTLESPLDCKEIQPVHPEDQSWVFIGRPDVEAETPILWPPDAKSWLIGKDPELVRVMYGCDSWTVKKAEHQKKKKVECPLSHHHVWCCYRIFFSCYLSWSCSPLFLMFWEVYVFFIMNEYWIFKMLFWSHLIWSYAFSFVHSYDWYI